ncbi:MAG: PIN domain-containing protein [Pseudomonadota bacterium]|nr:PIN domain-containing protein [Pseudomonadota bacterium]
MIVLVDTTIWSLALRRKQPTAQEQLLIDELAELIKELRAVLIGPIRQEVLSGISEKEKFEEVRAHLVTFDDLPIESADYEEAARAFNVCRSKGVQGSNIDFLICAAAISHSTAIFTTDKDFVNYAKYLDIVLHKPRMG